MNFVPGDQSGLAIPVDAAALRQAGPDFLDRAFRRFGTLQPGNRVVAITASEPCLGGSTGTKLLLSVQYERADPALHTDLFVKFSRDFADSIRDLGRHEMESEVQLAALSRHPSFRSACPSPILPTITAKPAAGC